MKEWDIQVEKESTGLIDWGGALEDQRVMEWTDNRCKGGKHHNILYVKLAHCNMA